MRSSPGRKAVLFFIFLIMLFIVVVTLYPMLYVLFASFSDPRQFLQHRGLLLWPTGYSVLSYRYLIEDASVLRSFGNSFLIMFSGVAINMVMTILGAYFLSRKNVLWKNAVMVLILITMYFNGGLVPSYINIKNLGMYNNYLALIFPAAISTTNLIILRTAFAGLPAGVEESAIIDGAGHLTLISRIVVPLCFPTIAVLILYYAVGHWNSWFPAMIYLQDKVLFPLQLILREKLILMEQNASATGGDIGDSFMIRETMKYAIIVLSSIPMLVLYPFIQRFFVKGVMIGSIKG
ncbi:MAG: carbohydrate ABC transporter permease [Oscillospiraceae bacterium]